MVDMQLSSQETEEIRTHLKVPACYQCKRCTNGCPVTFAMGLYPDEVIRRVNLGHMDKVLTCRTIWICSACETRTTRCPNEVDIAGVMDFMKEMALAHGVSAPEAKTRIFHESFLREIEKRGRVFEGGLMQRYMIRSGELFRKSMNGAIFEDVALGIKLRKRGRMRLLPENIKGRKDVRAFFRDEK